MPPSSGPWTGVMADGPYRMLVRVHRAVHRRVPVAKDEYACGGRVDAPAETSLTGWG